MHFTYPIIAIIAISDLLRLLYLRGPHWWASPDQSGEQQEYTHTHRTIANQKSTSPKNEKLEHVRKTVTTVISCQDLVKCLEHV